MKIDLEGIQQTLLMPLWGRAKLSKEKNAFFVDLKAIDIIEKINYDFTKIDKNIPYIGHIVTIVRAKMIDNTINEFLLKHSKATIINLGAGLDTTFYRIDNKLLYWYDIDLPEVINLRKSIIPETERSHYIAESIFDMQWTKYISNRNDGILFISAGVLEYFTTNKVRQFLSDLADIFQESEIVFNTTSNNRIARFFTNRNMKKMEMKANPAICGNDYINKITKMDKRIEIVERYKLFSKININTSWDKNITTRIKYFELFSPMYMVHLKFT